MRRRARGRQGREWRHLHRVAPHRDPGCSWRSGGARGRPQLEAGHDARPARPRRRLHQRPHERGLPRPPLPGPGAALGRAAALVPAGVRRAAAAGQGGDGGRLSRQPADVRPVPVARRAQPEHPLDAACGRDRRLPPGRPSGGRDERLARRRSGVRLLRVHGLAPPAPEHGVGRGAGACRAAAPPPHAREPAGTGSSPCRSGPRRGYRPPGPGGPPAAAVLQRAHLRRGGRGPRLARRGLAPRRPAGRRWRPGGRTEEIRGGDPPRRAGRLHRSRPRGGPARADARTRPPFGPRRRSRSAGHDRVRVRSR